MAWEEESVRECTVLLNNVILQVNIKDHWRWLLGPIHGYSVSGNFNIWHKLAPSKVSIFAWRLLQNRIPTKHNLVRRHALQPNDNLCVGGRGCIETGDTLFIGCDIFGAVWHLVCQLLGISFVFPGLVKDHYSQFIYMVGLPRTTHSFLKVIWLACDGQYGRIEIIVSSQMR